MATTIEDLHPDLVAHAFRLLDAPALATVSCATGHLHGLATDPNVWRELCLSTWPSLRRHPGLLDGIIPSFTHSHRSFFSQAYPFPFIKTRQGPSSSDADAKSLPGELISAIDIYYKGVPFFSRVVETKTSSLWFHGSPFRIDVLDHKEPVLVEPSVITAMTPSELTLSWIVIDQEGRRAVNLSSRKPVAVEKHWYTDETMVRFAVASGDGFAAMASVVITSGEEAGQVREVRLTVEDIDGICLSGRQSLERIVEAMDGKKKGRGKGEEEAEAKRRYEEHMRNRSERKERRLRKERQLDACCIAVEITIFLAFLVLVFFR